MKKILELVEEIEEWTFGDQDSFHQCGEVPIDGDFVFVARLKKINELKKLLACQTNKM